MQTTEQKMWSYIGCSKNVRVYENNNPQLTIIWGVLPISPQAPAGKPITYQLFPDERRYDSEHQGYVPITEENRERLRRSSMDKRSLLYRQVLRALQSIPGFPKEPTPKEIAEALRHAPLFYRVESAKKGTGKYYVTNIAHPGGWVPMRG